MNHRAPLWLAVVGAFLLVFAVLGWVAVVWVAALIGLSSSVLTAWFVTFAAAVLFGCVFLGAFGDSTKDRQ